jgi:UDP-glucose 4-epimerase
MEGFRPPKRLLITGGAGFIGSNLARMALGDPGISHVRILDDLSTGLLSNLVGLDVDFVEGSILDERALDAAMAGRDAVVHLAALPSVPRSVRDPIATHHANATGTLRVLQAAVGHGVEHAVVASSSSVYGANPNLPKRELDWTRPMSPYAVSKLATEAYAIAYQHTYGLPTLAFRFFNVYGPGQRHDHAYAAVIPRFVYAALRDEPILFFGDGHQSRDFTYVGTVCAALMDAVRRGTRHPHPVNLAFGVRHSLRAVVAELERILGRRLVWQCQPERVGDVRHSEADSELLHQLFPGIGPAPLAAGLEATVDWVRRDLARSGPLHDKEARR